MEEPKIIAERGGKIREFTRKAWDLMGTDKYGWVPVESMAPPVPKEVVGAPMPTDYYTKKYFKPSGQSEATGILSFAGSAKPTITDNSEHPPQPEPDRKTPSKRKKK